MADQFSPVVRRRVDGQNSTASAAAATVAQAPHLVAQPGSDCSRRLRLDACTARHSSLTRLVRLVLSASRSASLPSSGCSFATSPCIDRSRAAHCNHLCAATRRVQPYRSQPRDCHSHCRCRCRATRTPPPSPLSSPVAPTWLPSHPQPPQCSAVDSHPHRRLPSSSSRRARPPPPPPLPTLTRTSCLPTPAGGSAGRTSDPCQSE